MEDVKCLTCSVYLATSRTRRKLMTLSSGHITCVLLETLVQLVPAGKHVNTAILKNCYVCRLCFSSMERILKLKENLKQLSQDFSDKARSAVIFLPLADIESDEETTVEPRAPPVKRQHLFAPAVSPVLPLKKSPAVCANQLPGGVMQH